MKILPSFAQPFSIQNLYAAFFYLLFFGIEIVNPDEKILSDCGQLESNEFIFQDSGLF